jgi:hypothetical protein
MTRTLPIVTSVFVFSVCISVATPLAVTRSDVPNVDNNGIEQLTDAQLATVIGGEPFSDTVCDGLFGAADLAYKIAGTFGSSFYAKVGAGIEAGALAGGCTR